MPPTADQASTPLLSALVQAVHRQAISFHTPGHKGGQGATAAMEQLLGNGALRADLPELPELDNLFAPTGPIQTAQTLAAQAFGAEETYFLANGSTSGIEAALLATSGPGDTILVPRNAHRSVFSGLVLSGAQPAYVSPVQSPAWDLAWGLGLDPVAAALAAVPTIRTVVLVSPNYQGVCAPVTAIARQVHAHGACLLVDEAHGAHLACHPELPTTALAAGADVVVQSTHKTLSALTQAAMVHVQGQRIDRDRLRQGLQITQSTSPNYLLLASLDAARQQMALQGSELLDQTLHLVQEVRAALAALMPLKVLGQGDLQTWGSGGTDGFRLDPTRVTVDVSALGMTGFEADEFLHQQQGVTAELPTLRQLAFIFSLGTQPQDASALITALTALVTANSAPGTVPLDLESEPDTIPPLSIPPLTPREAFFAPQRSRLLAAAIGHISAETLCPYPPGIPLLLPGEVITVAAIAQIQAIRQAGGVLTGASDATLATLRVVDIG
jgi:arginine decarboxylase